MRRPDPVRDAVLEAVREGRLVVRLPNGDCYDKDGRVTGPAAFRRRDAERLREPPLADDVSIAPVDAPCVAEWLATVEHVSEDQDRDPRGSDVVVIAEDWDTAIEYAETRPLKQMRLKTQSPSGAKQLLSLAQPFSAQAITMKVSVQGELKDGGTAYFAVEGAKPTSAARPMDTAGGLHRAMLEEGASYEAEIELKFGERGADHATPRLRDAQGKAGSEIAVEAVFGPEANA